MSINQQVPDYELDDSAIVTKPAEIRAMTDSLRATILDLLLERAATVGELATSLGRPKSTVAHHVKVLVGAEMLRVVRTRRVRAIEERFYGRTARVFHIGAIEYGEGDPTVFWENDLTVAAAESAAAHETDTLRSIFRHARITNDQARQFWRRVDALMQEFVQQPREGDTVFGLVVGLYPTDHPTLPEPTPETT